MKIGDRVVITGYSLPYLYGKEGRIIEIMAKARFLVVVQMDGYCPMNFPKSELEVIDG